MFKAVIIGAPASGKGTISSRIIRNFEIFHLSTGDMLRNEIRSDSKFGREARAYIDGGKLVPDDLIINMLSSELKKMSRKNWLLDGFPRTKNQAEKLNEIERISYAINLIVPFNVIIDRVKGRWVHVPSGRVYNETFNAPKIQGKDDLTGEPLEQREDDKPEAVMKRLEIYQEMIEPVLSFYRDKNLLCNFEGNTSDEIWPKVQKSLSKYLKSRN